MIIQDMEQHVPSTTPLDPIPETNGIKEVDVDIDTASLDDEPLDVKPSLSILPPEDDVKIKISTSPTSSPSLMQGPNSAMSRRSTRKSTLTQQQKNSRRQRATADQLGLLEVEFNKNPTPTATVRERIAQEINMTERSVQIWFQNRRAKIKNLAKKSAETGEECDAIPESMRRYLAMQALESGKSFSGAELFVNGAMSPFPGGPMMDADAQGSKIMIHHLNCRSLSIGSWRRIGQTQLDLVVFYCPTKSMMTYYIQAESTGFRIEYPFSYIKDMTLDTGDVSASAEGASQQSASIVIELHHPPIFTMDQGSSQGWFQCRDFTEDQQASQILVHHLGGHAKVLSSQMAKLVSLDAYRMRHSTYDSSAIMSSAPVSPTLANRPASQPNHLVHPHMQVFHQGPINFNMGPPAPRGHKRQRSRSVPVAIDFSQRRLNQPLPDFMVHHQHQHHHVLHHSPVHQQQQQQQQPPPQPPPQNHIFAPVPQHVAQLPYHSPPMFNAGGQPLNVDTAAGFNFDFVPPAPPSATTATTPPSSEFESTIFTQKGPIPDGLSAPQAHTPYTGPFLSPLVDSSSLLDPSVSPLSAVSQPDQQVYDGAPQYIYRSASADLSAYQQHEKDSEFDSNALIPREKPMVYDTDTYFDEKSALDALLIDDPLVDPFSKQPLTLQFRTPMDDFQPLQSLSQDLESQVPLPRSRPVSEDFEFSHLIHLDPSNLSPEHEKPAFLA